MLLFLLASETTGKLLTSMRPVGQRLDRPVRNPKTFEAIPELSSLIHLRFKASLSGVIFGWSDC